MNYSDRWFQLAFALTLILLVLSFFQPREQLAAIVVKASQPEKISLINQHDSFALEILRELIKNGTLSDQEAQFYQELND